MRVAVINFLSFYPPHVIHTEVIPTADAAVAFKDIDVAILVGAMPRKEGMERKDLLKANAKIFESQGKALNDNAKKTVKVGGGRNGGRVSRWVEGGKEGESESSWIEREGGREHRWVGIQIGEYL